jgi:hypothetical protein
LIEGGIEDDARFAQGVGRHRQRSARTQAPETGNWRKSGSKWLELRLDPAARGYALIFREIRM